jgi:hypothetical protein
MNSFSRFNTRSAVFCGVGVLLLCLTNAATSGQDVSPDKKNTAGFVLYLGPSKSLIQATPAYSEASLKAVLPFFSDIAKRLKLPIPYPLTETDVVGYRITPWQEQDGGIAGVNITTKKGFWFSFFSGYVNGFSWPDTYGGMQNKNLHNVSIFFGTPKISREQAIQSARNTIKRLGIPLEDVFAEQEPQVVLPTWGTNTIDRYLVEWFDPRGEIVGAVRMEVNGKTGQVESALFNTSNLIKPSPKVNVVPPRKHGMFDSMIPPPVNPEYAWKLIPLMFAAIDEYAQILSLPIPRPLTTNNVSRIAIYNNDGWPHAEVTLTNGWRFVYRHTMVNGYHAPDNFFDSDNRQIHIRDFDGRWNLTTNQAIEVVRRAIAKLDYPTNHVHMDFTPNVLTAVVDKQHIPRLLFEWYYPTNGDLQSRLEAEVNADNGKLESLYYDDKAYWNTRPPIDVPISVSKP